PPFPFPRLDYSLQPEDGWITPARLPLSTWQMEPHLIPPSHSPVSSQRVPGRPVLNPDQFQEKISFNILELAPTIPPFLILLEFGNVPP
uniref:Uncharacterized protein n=1 Tax=Aegilops tauschii subsp. strangulata TaxID=200361 RepID=A0A453JCS6_AEGTS